LGLGLANKKEYYKALPLISSRNVKLKPKPKPKPKLELRPLEKTTHDAVLSSLRLSLSVSVSLRLSLKSRPLEPTPGA